MAFIEYLRTRITHKGIRIVFPEGEDPRVLWAAVEHQKEGLVHPIVIGFKNEIEATAKRENIDISGLEIVEVGQFEHNDELVEKFVERRKGKIDETRARAQLHDPNYLGTMMVYAGYADGMVSGAVHTTGQTILPALQIIKTKKGVNRVSGVFILFRGKECYLMADCAINTEMDAPTLTKPQNNSVSIRRSPCFPSLPRAPQRATRLRKWKSLPIWLRNPIRKLRSTVNFNSTPPSTPKLPRKRHRVPM